MAVKVFADVIEAFPGTVLMVSRFADRLALADDYWYLEGGKLASVVKNNRKLEKRPCIALYQGTDAEETGQGLK
jgi:hypothetical protein